MSYRLLTTDNTPRLVNGFAPTLALKVNELADMSHNTPKDRCAGIALMHVYVTQANFTTKPRFEIKNKRSFTEMNSQGSRVEKNTHAQKVQMQKILFTNEACW